MNAMERVNVREAPECFLANPGNMLFFHLDMFELLKNFGKATAAHELHGHPQLIFDAERVIVSDDIRMLALLHNVNLCRKQLDVLCIQSHLLDGHFLLGSGTGGQEYFSGGTLTNLPWFEVKLGGVLFADQLICTPHQYWLNVVT